MKARAGLFAFCAWGIAAIAAAQTGTPSATPPGGQPALAPAAAQPLPPNRWTLPQIREAFQLADTNGDGQLTRGEAQRLAIMPRTFELTDLNKDGVLTLDEYAASFGPQ